MAVIDRRSSVKENNPSRGSHTVVAFRTTGWKERHNVKLGTNFGSSFFSRVTSYGGLEENSLKDDLVDLYHEYLEDIDENERPSDKVEKAFSEQIEWIVGTLPSDATVTAVPDRERCIGVTVYMPTGRRAYFIFNADGCSVSARVVGPNDFRHIENVQANKFEIARLSNLVSGW